MVNFKSREEEMYFDWLCDRIGARRTYSRLMETLYTTVFYYSIPLDRNRVKDALTMQNDYIYELGLNPNVDYLLHNEDEISVLEVLIAMAIRVELNIMQDDDYGDRTSVWFWMMIDNLEINQRNSQFNEDYILWAVHRFMNRNYEYDGTGSIVKLENSHSDVRDMQIWHQFCLYLSELSERGEL